MTDPIQFDSTTARHEFPILVSGQAQKELFVNEALVRVDMLQHPVVESALADPPPDPLAGQAWIAAAPASGEWEGHEDQLASWDGWCWTFAEPQFAMEVFDRATASRQVFDGTWQSRTLPVSSSGGAVVDTEARAAIDAICDILATMKLAS